MAVRRLVASLRGHLRATALRGARERSRQETARATWQDHREFAEREGRRYVDGDVG